ncbi:MAG: CHASE sensor domain-containing protein, partial [Verrucomicrobiota bacterium]
MVITMLVSGIALAVACAAFMIYEQAAARKQMVQALNITAAMTAANSTAGLSFTEADSVAQALKSLSAQPDIVQACVYDKGGRQFARYLRNGAQTNSPAPPVENECYRFDHQRLELFQSINLAGETVGTIYLEQDLSQLTARLWRYFLIGTLVLLVSGAVAFFLSARLQKVISEPLSDLAKTVAVVRTGKDYSVRAAKQGDDELGSLIDGFNEMLAQIQERDMNLERRVGERTQELAESLSVLNATLGSTADGIHVVNPQGKIIFQNRRTAEFWKIPPAIAESDDDNAQIRYVMNATTDPARFAEQVAYYYAHPNEKGQDEVQLKDGTMMERITAPVLDREGRCYGRIWTFRDVTQNRKYEAALRESQARFKFIFETVPVGIASHMVHPDGRISHKINDAHLRICGLTREQHDQPDIYAKLVHPADYTR